MSNLAIACTIFAIFAIVKKPIIMFMGELSKKGMAEINTGKFNPNTFIGVLLLLLVLFMTIWSMFYFDWRIGVSYIVTQAMVNKIFKE